MKINRIIITGATGAVGSALIDHFVSIGVEIYVLCRRSSERSDNIIENSMVTIKRIDLHELGDFESEKDFDVFYHLAWDGTYGESRNDVYKQYFNIGYTLEAIKLACKLGCHTFIGAGSQAEYGKTVGKMTSNTMIKPENGYGIAKFSAGKLGAMYAEQLGLRYIWTRILSVYGPKDGVNSMIMSTINQLLDNKIPKLTKGEQVWDYIYSADAAKALAMIAEKGENQKTYCIGSGEEKSLKEYVYMIRDAIDSSLSIDFGSVPYNVNQTMNLSVDLEELTNDTGFIPETSFEVGIKKTIQYCREQRNERI